MTTAHTEPQIQRIDINGIQVAEARAGASGNRLPVLLLHGWGAEISLVWPLAERLGAAGHDVYMLDLPGFGASDPPPTAWRVADYARLVLAYMDYHHLERVNLFGHSFGGRIGLILGAEHAGRIGRMALAGCAGLRTPAPAAARIRLRMYKALRSGMNKIGLRGAANRMATWYNARYGSADFLATAGVMRETFSLVVAQDLADYAVRVRPSTLLLWGDLDEETPLWQGRKLEQLIPDAGLVIYERAGHYCYLDRLQEAARVIDFFFREG